VDVLLELLWLLGVPALAGVEAELPGFEPELPGVAELFDELLAEFPGVEVVVAVDVGVEEGVGVGVARGVLGVAAFDEELLLFDFEFDGDLLESSLASALKGSIRARTRSG
jgi:hypothetical protein